MSLAVRFTPFFRAENAPSRRAVVDPNRLSPLRPTSPSPVPRKRLKNEQILTAAANLDSSSFCVVFQPAFY